MLLTTLDILYSVLIVFVTIIGTLLTIVLVRLMAILGVVREITDYYNKIKKIINTYSQIPDGVKKKAKEALKKTDS